MEIDLPESHSTIEVAASSVIEIVISADDEIRIGERSIPNVTVDVLKVELAAHLNELDSDRVVIRADAKAHHETVGLGTRHGEFAGLK